MGPGPGSGAYGVTYLLISLPFLAVAGLVLVLAGLRGRLRRTHRIGMGLALVLLAVLTALFDSVIIGLGVVDYTGANISGLRIGLAPVEDFTYPVAGVALLTGLWVLVGGGQDRGRVRSQATADSAEERTA